MTLETILLLVLVVGLILAAFSLGKVAGVIHTVRRIKYRVDAINVEHSSAMFPYSQSIAWHKIAELKSLIRSIEE